MKQGALIVPVLPRSAARIGITGMAASRQMASTPPMRSIAAPVGSSLPVFWNRPRYRP
jgi:hypothetical protein